jgi:inositol phosphorylceramide mannosyltransferase catalytic subunit
MAYDLLARPDVRANKLYVAPEPMPYSPSNFTKTEVPKIIHQIWVRLHESDKKAIPSHVLVWEAYCKRFGYTYKMWTEKDIELIKNVLRNDGVLDLYMGMNANHVHKSMSDILRLCLLHQFGGIYLDCDFPCHLTKPLEEYFFLHNMTLMTEIYARNVNQNSAHFFHSSIMISNPGHPILLRNIQSLNKNVEQTQPEEDWIMTGPMLLNRCIYGIIHMIRFNDTWLKHPTDMLLIKE